MNNDNQDVLSELSDLIESLTTSGSRTLDENLFKRVKSICKCSDENVRHSYRMIMTQLEKRHSEIRLSALQIINEIFLRSHAFRELLVDDLQKFFSLTIGVNSKKPLPEPNAVANILRSQALKAIEKWHQKYGPHYVKLALGYKYLKRVKKFNFDDFQSHTEVERLRAQDVENRRTNLAEQKLNTVLAEMADLTADIQSIIKEMENCFRLVLPSLEEFDIYATNSSDPTLNLLDSDTPSTSSGITHNNKQGSLSPNEQHSLSNNELNDHGLMSQSYQLVIPLSTSVEIIETADNTDVLNTLQELQKQIVDKYLPSTQKWLEVLTKHSGHHENLVQAIDLKNSLTELRYKFDKLTIISTTAQRNVDECDKNIDDETTDGFIDVPEKEGLEHVPESLQHEYGLEPVKNRSLTTSTTIGGDEGSSDKPQTTNTISWNPHGNPSTLGDPSSRVTAIAALLEKHERKVTQKPSKYVSSCTITKADYKQDLNKAGSSSSKKDTEAKDKRSELLKRAPVVPFGMDLYNWERKDNEAPSVTSLKSLHCYWTHPNEDNEDHCPSDIKESMKSRSIRFSGEFEEIKWACRAPLPSGKLCPRRDRYKCPFHGKIIRRDAMGRPEGSPSESDESTDFRTQEINEVTRDIELATGMDLGSKKEKKGKKRKHSGLTDLKKNSNTSRARLEKIVLNKEALKRVADETDRVKKRIIDEKFGNNWNYALN